MWTCECGTTHSDLAMSCGFCEEIEEWVFSKEEEEVIWTPEEDIYRAV